MKKNQRQLLIQQHVSVTKPWLKSVNIQHAPAIPKRVNYDVFSPYTKKQISYLRKLGFRAGDIGFLVPKSRKDSKRCRRIFLRIFLSKKSPPQYLKTFIRDATRSVLAGQST